MTVVWPRCVPHFDITLNTTVAGEECVQDRRMVLNLATTSFPIRV